MKAARQENPSINVLSKAEGLTLGTSALDTRWATRRDMLSPRYTIDWNNLLTVHT